MIQLKNKHIYLPKDIVEQLCGQEEKVNFVFYPERKNLLLAGRDKTFFEKLHKVQWTVLKLRNIIGDRTMAVEDLLIDHEIDADDRVLNFELKQSGILSIQF